MRHVLIASGIALAAVTAGTQSSRAEPAPFCLVSSVYLGMPDCTYYTWAQCRASIGGGGDACELNLNGRYAFDVSDPAHPRVVSQAPRPKARARRY